MDHDQDKSAEFFEPQGSDNASQENALQDLLSRLRTIAACFRKAFPEAVIFNESVYDEPNGTAWSNDYSDWKDADDGSLFHTVIILCGVCIVALLLIVRSSRGGSCAPCKAENHPDNESPVKEAKRREHSTYQMVPPGHRKD
ncbi:hypothetical protein RvY_10233 [Ramazzottius varieornatus]|uniref:Uncharacterized protein n=1 Tax=Ramazzottius varieornatus TaxID=947166 RepID=A0A1D1VL48_RAMVA|nr:hypothetical protein RvY_10233 [Ramazzottius varieornatus]